MSTRFFRKLFMRRHTQHSARARWVVPTLEPLEHRNLLAATYLWTGDGNGNWSDPADWQNKATGKPATVAPGSTDSVTFDGTHLVNCNVDPAATTTVHDLTVDVTYIKRIDFRRNLAVAGGVASIGGGEI